MDYIYMAASILFLYMTCPERNLGHNRKPWPWPWAMDGWPPAMDGWQPAATAWGCDRGFGQGDSCNITK